VARDMPWTTLEEYIESLQKTRYRGLVVLNTNSLAETLDALTRRLSGNCGLIAPKRLLKGTPRCDHISPGHVEHVLGREYGNIIVATDGLLRPNLVAAAAGAVSAGGILAIVAPPLSSWEPAPPGGRGGYRRYLLASLREAGSIFWWDEQQGVLLDRRPEKPATGWPQKPRRLRRCRLEELAATEDQADALDKAIRALARGVRSVLIRGDRGRGKSFLLGLIIAAAVRRGLVGEAIVVAPTPQQATSVFKALHMGLKRLGIKHRLVRDGDVVVKATGPWGRVVYAEPEEARPAGLLVVDEAATIGIARLRSLSWRSGRTLAATTIHGYEGSGRVFAHMVLDTLPRPVLELELVKPIRYPPNDPLENWVVRVFVLNPDPPPLDASLPPAGSCRANSLPAEPSVDQVRAVMRLLASAHYRSEPDYLLVILEASNHKVYTLECAGYTVAVADVAHEEPSYDEPARLSQKILEVQLRAAGIDDKPRLSTWRIVRIAVHPALQRRGYGSKLLSYIENSAITNKVDAVTTLFSRHDVIGFWLKNDYILYYVSPRFNKATGEKNLAFVKPLTPRAQQVFAAASREARRKLVLAAHGVYRDLAAEKIATLIKATTPWHRPPLAPGPAEARALAYYIKGYYELEQVMDSAYIVLASALLANGVINMFTLKELTAVVARILQGKPIKETAGILGMGVQEAQNLIRDAVRKALTVAAVGKPNGTASSLGGGEASRCKRE